MQEERKNFLVVQVLGYYQLVMMEILIYAIDLLEVILVILEILKQVLINQDYQTLLKKD